MESRCGLKRRNRTKVRRCCGKYSRQRKIIAPEADYSVRFSEITRFSNGEGLIRIEKKIMQHEQHGKLLHSALKEAEGYAALGMWEEAWKALEDLPDSLRVH